MLQSVLYKFFALHNAVHYGKDGEGSYAACAEFVGEVVAVRNDCGYANAHLGSNLLVDIPRNNAL